MNFSLRTALLSTAIVATLLGAIVSKSPLFLESVATLIYLGIALTLPLAIWDPLPRRRAFWTGFFVLGLASVLMANQLGSYQQASTNLASLIVPVFPVNVNFGNSVNVTAQSFTFYTGTTVAAPQYPLTSVYGNTNPAAVWSTNSTQAAEQYQAIRSTLPTIFSLVAAVIGGWLTWFVGLGKLEAPHRDSGTSNRQGLNR